MKIKNALNRISTAQGGFRESPPHQKMDEYSGLMDERTLEAIQKFQLKQFGWSGADRRIFPNGQTITRINELLPEEAIKPEIHARSNIFFIQLSPPKFILADDSIFLIIDDVQNHQRAKYIVTGQFSKPEIYTKQQRILWRGLPISVKDLDNADFQYATAARVEKDTNAIVPPVITENVMAIKPVNDSNWKMFHTEPILHDPYFTALGNTWNNTEESKNWVRKKIVGKLTLVEFET